MEEDQALFDLIIDTIIFGFLVAKTRNKKKWTKTQYYNVWKKPDKWCIMYQNKEK